MSKSDYLKKYLTEDTEKDKKRRKKKRTKGNLAVIDADVNWDEMKHPSELGLEGEFAPQVVNVIDNRAEDIKRKQDGWKTVGKKDDSSPIRSSKSRKPVDVSPPRRKKTTKNKSRRKVDKSPPRRARKASSSASPPARAQIDSSPSDSSPPRRLRKNSDASPPRRRRDSDVSPPRRSRKDSDASPPRRRRGNDSDESPVRRARKDSDDSPPRKRRGADSDESPPRRRRNDTDSEEEADGGRQKMMDGSKSGLNTKAEFLALRPTVAKNSNLAQIIEDAKNAETVYREKGTGKKRDFQKEEEEDEEERKRKEEELKNYKVWNKGKKQLEVKEENIQSYMKEIEKPLARYKDDKDFNDMKKSEMFTDDPMYAYMMSKKKVKTKTARQKSSKLVYTGSSTAPNRFEILPGYRWDGVDRSTGYENKLFKYHNEKKIQVTQAWRANTDDF